MISAFLQFEKHWWGIAFAIAFPLFILFVPVLTGFAVFDYPETSAMHQQFFAYKDAISRNDSFLWDPGIFSGFPGIATLSVFFLPILFFLVLKSQEKKTWPVVCGVLTVGLMWLMGHWHFVIESLMAA